MENSENELESDIPFTWAQLKEFCNSLSDEQLKQTVKLVRPDYEETIDVVYASELGEDYYYFTEWDDSVSKGDFDKLYHFDGKYQTFEEALEKEEHSMTRANSIYLFDL